jgi:hypothetical protein
VMLLLLLCEHLLLVLLLLREEGRGLLLLRHTTSCRGARPRERRGRSAVVAVRRGHCGVGRGGWKSRRRGVGIGDDGGACGATNCNGGDGCGQRGRHTARCGAGGVGGAVAATGGTSGSTSSSRGGGEGRRRKAGGALSKR